MINVNPVILSYFLAALGVYFAFMFFVFYKLEQRREARMEVRLSVFLASHADKFEMLEEFNEWRKNKNEK